ncbi:DNA polymerase IV [Akkermansia sp. JRP_AM1]
MKQRKIIHVDMDAFYASIEQRDHPEYRGKPIAVGRPEMRGVVAAASYEARRFGVRSAMPSMKAMKLCPKLIFTRNRMDVYKSVSAQIRSIFHRYTDLVEPLSLDEAFLDVTENKPGIPLAVDIARRIKREIRQELHLTASAGVSYNKFLAKIASDYRKPDGLFTIHPSRAEEFIARLPIEAFWGVGHATAERMRALSITNGAQLRERSLDFLLRHFGKIGGSSTTSPAAWTTAPWNLPASANPWAVKKPTGQTSPGRRPWNNTFPCWWKSSRGAWRAPASGATRLP